MERIRLEMRKECSQRSLLTGKQGLLRQNTISLRHTDMIDKIFSQYVLSQVFLTSNHPYFLPALKLLWPEPFCISYFISETFRLISIALRLFSLKRL